MTQKIMIITRREQREDLIGLCRKNKYDLKVVADIERCLLAAGGEMHIEEERALIADGSKPANLWGANYFPKENRITYTSMINIKPARDNLFEEISDPLTRSAVRLIILHLLGE
jgi:hypothetical protein